MIKLWIWIIDFSLEAQIFEGLTVYLSTLRSGKVFFYFEFFSFSYILTAMQKSFFNIQEGYWGGGWSWLGRAWTFSLYLLPVQILPFPSTVLPELLPFICCFYIDWYSLWYIPPSVRSHLLRGLLPSPIGGPAAVDSVGWHSSQTWTSSVSIKAVRLWAGKSRDTYDLI